MLHNRNESAKEVLNQAVSGTMPKLLNVDFHWDLNRRKNGFDSDDDVINADYGDESSMQHDSYLNYSS